MCVDLCGVLYRWIFRHVLHFLRDGAIPDDPPLLQELYAHMSLGHKESRPALFKGMEADVYVYVWSWWCAGIPSQSSTSCSRSGRPSKHGNHAIHVTLPLCHPLPPTPALPQRCCASPLPNVPALPTP